MKSEANLRAGHRDSWLIVCVRHKFLRMHIGILGREGLRGVIRDESRYDA